MSEYEKVARVKIGEAIKMAMIERGVTQMQLHERSGVSRSIIDKVLSGQNYEINSLIRLVRILQIHVDVSLLDEKNNVFTTGGIKPSDN